MTDTATAASAPETDEPKGAKASVTKRDVTALLASFEPEAPKTESAAEKERARRIGRLETGIRTLAKNLEEWGVTEGTPADAAAALRALQTVLKKGTAAINSLTEVKLGVAEKTTRAPRASKPVAETPVRDQDDPQDADPATDGPAVAADGAPEESPEAVDARIKEQRAARSGPSFSTQGGPAGGSEDEGF
jgi:hypothetical protein